MENEKKTSDSQRSVQPRKPQTRNSKAAQTAQRHREERQERARLENIREKQTKKAKRRNKARKRIKRETLRRILIMVAIAAALVLSMIIFFRVRTIDVQGISYYNQEEIIEASGLEKGDNLLIISRADIAGNIMANCPYVESVRVSRQLPDTIIISIEEYDATYAVRDGNGDCYLITAGGKATEKIAEGKAADYIQIQNLTIVTPEIGDYVQPMAPAGQEIAAEGQMNALKLLLKAIEDNELLKEVASVSVPNSYEMSLWYTDRFLVQIGDESDLNYKMNFLKQVVQSQKPYAVGTIDLTRAAEGKTFVSLTE